MAAASAAAGGLLAARVVRPGPLAAPAPPFRPRYALTLFRERGPRLANLGYFGHMWELYAVWTWLPAYLAASTATTGAPLPVGVVAFLAIGVAGVGRVPARRLAGRPGRAGAAGGAGDDGERHLLRARPRSPSAARRSWCWRWCSSGVRP